MAILIMPAHEAGDRRGTVLAWHKRVGDWVEKGDKLFTYSMESGVYLAVCEQAGRLAAIYLPAGESAPCPADAALLAAPSAAGALRFAQLDDVRQAETAPLEEEAPSEEAPSPEDTASPEDAPSLEEAPSPDETPSVEEAPSPDEAASAEEAPSPEDAAETAPLEEETPLVEETPQEPDEVPAEGSALSVSQQEPAEEGADAEKTEKTAPTPETPAGPGGFTCFERFRTAAFRRLAEAFRLTRPALKGAPIDEKALLLCLCLRTDASALGLEAYAELGLQDVADFLAEGLMEAENVQLTSLLAAVPARCPGLTVGRLEEEAVLCLRARSKQEAERFLPALRDALEAPDRLI